MPNARTVADIKHIKILHNFKKRELINDRLSSNTSINQKSCKCFK